MLINFNIQWFSQIIFLGENNSSHRESSVGNKQPQTLVGLFLYPENGITLDLTYSQYIQELKGG